MSWLKEKSVFVGYEYDENDEDSLSFTLYMLKSEV
jgi:hypothetical protein